MNGACLTVVGRDGESCRFQAGFETLQKTNLGELRVGDRVNLERALKFGDRLGGHLVTGHVDVVGRIAERTTRGDFELIWFSVPPEWTMQMVPKGSIAVDGISLTLVDVTADRFSVMLIPHTLAVTTLGGNVRRRRSEPGNRLAGKIRSETISPGLPGGITRPKSDDPR